tara:strand:- start:3004 stop:8058 length:5055 start_codon:yes stop_codon:yes gene_type:complete
MAFISNDSKINYLYKKQFDTVSTNSDYKIFQESNYIFGNRVNTKSIIFNNRQLYRDSINDTVPNELLNILYDDNNNNIEGSLIGKTCNQNIIKKIVKLELIFLDGSIKYDNDNNIKEISFYHNLLEDSIPYNYDYKGSYSYELYKKNNSLINYTEGDWIVDNESGILSFYDRIEGVDQNNPPKITFYKYNGNKGLYPLTFNSNYLINIKSNLTIDENLYIKKNVTIDNDLNINHDLIVNNNIDITNNLKVKTARINDLLEVNKVDFDRYSILPPHNNKNKLVCTDESLYFYHNNTWNNLINKELFTFSHDQFLYNITDNTQNKININRNLTIIEISEILTDNVYIELPIITKNGAELTIIMGQSITQYISDFNIIISGKFLTTDGVGPSPGNIKFNKTGQALKIMSILNQNSNIFGYDNNYFQILFNNYTSITIQDDDQVNQTVDDQLTPTYTFEENMFDTNSINSIDVLVYQTIIQLNTLLNNNIYIILPLIDTPGVEKLITFGKSVENNLNNKKIILYSKFIEPSGLGPVFLNIEFIQGGQSIKLVSIKSKSNEMYWQILYGNFDINDTIIFDNNTYTTENDPGLLYRSYVLSATIYGSSMSVFYEQVVYNDLKLNLFDLSKLISVLELDFYLNKDIIITLPNLEILGTEKIIIMGESISKYNNGHKIILSTICKDQNGQGPHNMYIEFSFTAQYIKLISFINKNQELYGFNQQYWQILYGAFDLFSFNDLTIDPIISYIKLLDINPVNINTINLEKTLSILELNINIQSNIYVIIPLVNTNYFEKTIIFGESINQYINNKEIIIYGYFYNSNTNSIQYLNLSFNKSGQTLKLVSIFDSLTNNYYWKIIYSDHILNTTSVDHLYQSYIINYQNNYITSYQELSEGSNININKNYYTIVLNNQLTSDLTFTLENIDYSGICKKFILSESTLSNLNNFNIIIKANFYIHNQNSFNTYNIKLNQNQNYLEIISIFYNSNKYYQILSNIDSNSFTLQNTLTTTANFTNTPQINYEFILYQLSNNNILSITKHYSIIELNQTLTDNAFIYLPLSLSENSKKTIIMGNSVNQYINNFNIILYTKLIDSISGTTSYYSIIFNSSGQYINLVSVFNISNKYYHLLNNKIFQKTIINNVSNNIKTIINNNTTIETNTNQYTASELDKIEIMIFNKNINNIITLNKKYTIIELTETLTNDIYILVPNLTIHGVEKNIILGNSVDQYINNYNIIIYSKYNDLEGRGPLFLNIKLFKSGHLLKLVSVIFTHDDGQINKYWQILMGSFENTDEIRFNSQGNYINTTTDGSTYNTIIDDDFYTQQYQQAVTDNDLHVYEPYDDVFMHSSITIKDQLNLEKDLNLTNINFNVSSSLPSYNTNTMIYTNDNLYFNHNNKWTSLLNEDLQLLNSEHFIYDSSIVNLINVNTNLSIIEITQTLTNNAYIILPTSSRNGVEKTIIMGQSINKYINNYNITLYSKFIDVSGIGPSFMNLNFNSTGQSIKLISICPNNSNIFGNGNKYWQIIMGHFDCTDTFSFSSDNYTNINDQGSSFQNNVNSSYQHTSYSTDMITTTQNNLIDTLYIETLLNNTIPINTKTTLIQFSIPLISSITINLPTSINYGQEKTILLGDSIGATNTHQVQIKSTFFGGYSTYYFNSVSTNAVIKFVNPGQCIKLMAMRSSQNINYWHILSGNFTT